VVLLVSETVAPSQPIGCDVSESTKSLERLSVPIWKILRLRGDGDQGESSAETLSGVGLRHRAQTVNEQQNASSTIAAQATLTHWRIGGGESGRISADMRNSDSGLIDSPPLGGVTRESCELSFSLYLCVSTYLLGRSAVFAQTRCSRLIVKAFVMWIASADSFTI
jgi:hypothetical protein